MRYVEARLKQQQQDETYRIYVTDALKAISESTAKFAGGQYMNIRYADNKQPEPAKEEKEEDTRTAQEFARDFMKKAMKKAR